MLGCNCVSPTLGFFYDDIWGVKGIERDVLAASGAQAPRGFIPEEGYAPDADAMELQAWPYAQQTGYQEFEDVPISQLLGLRGMGALPSTPKVLGIAVLAVAAAAAIYLYTSRRK
jgi:hypothetical protein